MTENDREYDEIILDSLLSSYIELKKKYEAVLMELMELRQIHRGMVKEVGAHCVVKDSEG